MAAMNNGQAEHLRQGCRAGRIRRRASSHTRVYCEIQVRTSNIIPRISGNHRRIRRSLLCGGWREGVRDLRSPLVPNVRLRNDHRFLIVCLTRSPIDLRKEQLKVHLLLSPTEFSVIRMKLLEILQFSL